jgi:hypothetical protein
MLADSQPTVLFPWPMLRGNSCTQLAHCFIRQPNSPVGRVPPSHFHKQRFWIGSVRQPSTNSSGFVVGSALLLQTKDIIGKSLRYEATDPIRLPMLPSQARSSINPGTGRVHLSARRRRRFRHNQRVCQRYRDQLLFLGFLNQHEIGGGVSPDQGEAFTVGRPLIGVDS